MAKTEVISDEDEGLSGTAQAAILLMALGADDAAAVIQHLDTRETRTVSYGMTNLGTVTTEQVRSVFERFQSQVGSQTALGGLGTEGYIRSVLGKAMGSDKAQSLVSAILLGSNAKGIDELKWIESKAIANIIRNEHPQIVAIILSLLESDKAGEVLQYLPENTRADLLMRVANLEGVQPAALEALNTMLEQQLSGADVGKSGSAGIGGLKVAANILNQMDGSVESTIREQVKDQDESLAEKIEELMFVFENLMDVDDRGIQTLLRELPADRLALAMKGGSEELNEKIFKNMSSRASELLRDDLETMGPVRLKDVEGAQKEVVAVTRKLAEEGTIMLGGAGGDDFL